MAVWDVAWWFGSGSAACIVLLRSCQHIHHLPSPRLACLCRRDLGRWSSACRHDCCPLRGGVGCDDNQHCCPADAPVCDTQAGTCSSTDGQKTVQWTAKAPASYDFTGGSSSSDESAAPNVAQMAKMYSSMHKMQMITSAQKPQGIQQQEVQE